MSFQYFLNRVSALKFPLTATEQYAYKSVPSVESLKLMTIIEAKKGQNAQLYWHYRGLNKIMIYIDYARMNISLD